MSAANLEGLEDEILRSIRRIIRAIELHSQNLVQQLGLTSPQLSVLKAVERLHPATPTTLARELSVSQPTMSGILERLQAKGLLERDQGTEDRRMRGYQLTSSARQVLGKAPSLLQEAFLRRLGRVQDWERSMLLASLQRIAAMMDAEELEAHPLLTPGLAPLGADREPG